MGQLSYGFDSTYVPWRLSGAALPTYNTLTGATAVGCIRFGTSVGSIKLHVRAGYGCTLDFALKASSSAPLIDIYSDGALLSAISGLGAYVAAFALLSANFSLPVLPPGDQDLEIRCTTSGGTSLFIDDIVFSDAKLNLLGVGVLGLSTRLGRGQ
jgi:hypothetical protein